MRRLRWHWGAVTARARLFAAQCYDLQTMFFLFEKRRCWVRSATHTVVFERDPEFHRFAQQPGGVVKTFVRIWLTGWNDAPSYVGGVWTQGNIVRKSELRRVARNVVRRVGSSRARPLIARLLRQLVDARDPSKLAGEHSA